jgi:hypothetical protein
MDGKRVHMYRILSATRGSRTRLRTLLPLLALAAATLSCVLPFTGDQPQPEATQPPATQDLSLLATNTQEAADLSAQETAAALSATPTDTPEATITLTPAPTETAGPTLEPQPVLLSEIKFRTGGTMSFQEGSMSAGQLRGFTFWAAAGQTLLASVSSNDQAVYFELRGDDGSLLVPFSDQSSSVTIELPYSQDYQLTLRSPNDNVYFLTLEIPAEVYVGPGYSPRYVDGYLEVFQQFHPDVFTRIRYLIVLEEGTILNVQLSSPALEDLSLALTGAEDGQPYLRYEVKSDSIDDLEVTTTQGYYLDVYGVDGVSTGFRLRIAVTE